MKRKCETKDCRGTFEYIRNRRFCDECQVTRHRDFSDKWYKEELEKHPKKIRKRNCEYQRRRREKNPEKSRQQNRGWAREQSKRLKLEALAHYGRGRKVLCRWPGCGETDPDCLTMDHVNDDGARERATGNIGGIALMWRLKRKGWPSGFQTLCGSHQLKKEMLRRRRNRK